MTILEALREIDRKHDGYATAKLNDPYYLRCCNHTQMAYWYYHWWRDKYGTYYIEDLDEYWQLL